MTKLWTWSSEGPKSVQILECNRQHQQGWQPCRPVATSNNRQRQRQRGTQRGTLRGTLLQPSGMH